MWHWFHEANNPNSVGGQITNWMEDNKAQATCAVPAMRVNSLTNPKQTNGDHGVIGKVQSTGDNETG